MSPSQQSAGRVVFLGVVAAFIAFLLVQALASSAQFSWSSDPWMELIPAVIVGAGILAAVTLVVRLLIRRR